MLRSKKMKQIVFIILLQFFLISLFGSNSHSFSDLKKPAAIEVDQSQLYIIDDTSVLIYSLKDYKLIKKVGRRGEGPGEFKNITSIHIYDDAFLVNSRGKVSLFSKDGKLLKEVKALSGYDFEKVGEYFIGSDVETIDKISYMTANLHDSELKKIKQISRREGALLGSKFLDPILIYAPLGPEFRASDDKVVVKKQDGKFLILDITGKTISTITPDYQRLPVTIEQRESILNFYRTNPNTRDNFLNLKKRFKFSKYFPYVRNFHLDQNNLYILTFNKMLEKREIFIFNTCGKFMDRIFVTIEESNILQLYPYIIKNSKLYQMVESEDDWKIEVTSLKH